MPSGVKITGRWTFTGSNDVLQILVRSDGIPAGTYGETANGIEFYLGQDGTRNLLIRSKNNATITVTQNTTGQLASAGAGQSFDFIIEDKGNGQLSFTMTQVGNPGNSATSTATVTSDNFAQNFIVFHNREGGHTSYLDDVSITRFSLPPTAVVFTGITRDQGSGAMTLTFKSSAYYTYKVEASTDLTTSSTLNGAVVGQPVETTYLDNTFGPAEDRVFYRVSLQL